MTHDRDPDSRSAATFADLLGADDDPALRQVVSDLDALYSVPQPPAQLRVRQEWATNAAPSRRATTGASMFSNEKILRPRRAQLVAATVAAALIVGLLSILLTRGAPTKQQPTGVNTSTGDAAVLQRFAEQGGANIMLDARCLPGAGQCDVGASLPQLISVLRERLTDAGAAQSVFVQQIDTRTLSLLIPGLKDDAPALALVSNVGQLNIIDTGETQLPVATMVTVCPSSSANCPAGSYHVVFTGQQIDSTSISATTDRQSNQPVLTFAFKAPAAQQFADFTRQNVGRYLTITLDGQVIVSAVIQSEISGQIDVPGLSDVSSARNLVAMLKSGALPLGVAIASQRIEAATSCTSSTSSTTPLGVPAITPRIAHPAAGEFAYTAADARAWALAHPAWQADQQVSIVQVYQLTALQAAVIFDGECTGLPDDHPVVVVQLTGDFPPPSAPPSAATPSATPANVTHYAAEVFDGVTGNLVMTTNLGK